MALCECEFFQLYGFEVTLNVMKDKDINLHLQQVLLRKALLSL